MRRLTTKKRKTCVFLHNKINLLRILLHIQEIAFSRRLKERKLGEPEIIKYETFHRHSLVVYAVLFLTIFLLSFNLFTTNRHVLNEFEPTTETLFENMCFVWLLYSFLHPQRKTFGFFRSRHWVVHSPCSPVVMLQVQVHWVQGLATSRNVLNLLINKIKKLREVI